MKTIKVKSWDESQGPFVLVNECDYDENTHELFSEDGNQNTNEAVPKPIDKMTVKELEEYLTANDIEIPEGAKKADLVKLAIEGSEG